MHFCVDTRHYTIHMTDRFLLGYSPKNTHVLKHKWRIMSKQVVSSHAHDFSESANDRRIALMYGYLRDVACPLCKFSHFMSILSLWG